MNTLTRRSFIKKTSAAGISLVIGINMANGKTAAIGTESDGSSLTPFIRIDPDGAITIFNIKPEMGQGTFQSIPALIAEELEINLEQASVEFTDGDPKFGGWQGVGGGSSIRGNFEKFRKVGASARTMLIEAAAARWGVPAAECSAAEGKILHTTSGQSLSYGELASDAARLDVPEAPTLKDPKDFRIIGKPAPRLDIPQKVSGKAMFGIDAELPGMIYATVQRCPVIGGTLKSFDPAETLKVPGVLKVVPAERIMGRHHATGVAVLAQTYWAALQGRNALKIEWDTRGLEHFNSEDYEARLRELSQQEGQTDFVTGDVQAISGKINLNVLYETPMVAHHTMEPMNCIAHVNNDHLELWLSTQVPGALKGKGDNDLSKLTGIPAENIQVHNHFIGGGFGRRLYVDFVIEAVNIAKQTTQPVKVIWTREDTTQCGPFRPMTFSRMQGTIDPNGLLTSLQHKVIAPSLRDSSAPGFDKSTVDNMMTEGTGEQEYQIPNLKTTYVHADFHVPVAAWRSVTSSTVAFAHECFIDELAAKAGTDPMDFRLAMLPEDSDTRRILQKLREVSHWDQPLPKGRGRGVAQWKFFAGHCAQVVEVSFHKKTRSVTIDKVYAVIDLGTVVNPDTVVAQVEGSVIMAIGAAVQTGITLKNGQVVQSNFHDNPQQRIHETPEIEVHILADGGKIKGVGEPGLPPLAPALGNAIFAACGKRMRKLPVNLNKLW